MSAHTITTPEQEQVLRQAATLSRMLQQAWSRADSYDVVMLPVAELLEAHADTGTVRTVSRTRTGSSS